MPVWRRLFRSRSEAKAPQVAHESVVMSDSWAQACVRAPSQDHWTEVPIRQFDPFCQVAVAAFEQGFTVHSAKALELFRAMVAAQCPKCQGVISGDQVLSVGAYQQAQVVVGLIDFTMKLVDGRCPGCSHDTYLLKWIGGNF
jgi:hypothetical protein